MFWSNGRAQRMNKRNKEGHIFLSNGRARMKELNQ